MDVFQALTRSLLIRFGWSDVTSCQTELWIRWSALLMLFNFGSASQSEHTCFYSNTQMQLLANEIMLCKYPETVIWHQNPADIDHCSKSY